METPKSRLLQLLSALGMGQGSFEKEIGAGNGVITHSKDALTPALYKKIAAAYPSVNVAWLQTGKGDMFLSQEVAVPAGLSPEETAICMQRARLMSEIASQQAIIAHLQKQIASAQHQIDECQKVVSEMTNLCSILESRTLQKPCK